MTQVAEGIGEVGGDGRTGLPSLPARIDGMRMATPIAATTRAAASPSSHWLAWNRRTRARTSRTTPT